MAKSTIMSSRQITASTIYFWNRSTTLSQSCLKKGDSFSKDLQNLNTFSKDTILLRPIDDNPTAYMADRIYHDGDTLRLMVQVMHLVSVLDQPQADVPILLDYFQLWRTILPYTVSHHLPHWI